MALSASGLTALSLIQTGFKHAGHLPTTLLDLHLRPDDDSPPPPSPGVLTPMLGRLQALTNLCMDSIPFTHPPSGMSCLTSLRQLAMLNNPDLATLGYIGRLHQLESLTLHDCPALEGLPASLSGLYGLHTLSLSYTPLHYVSPALPALRRLHVDLSPMLGLPASLGVLTGIEELTLHSCNRLVEAGALAALTRLTRLDVDGCLALVSLPTMPALVVLNADASGVWQLSALPSLQVLEMQVCCLERLPPRLSTLTTLRRLQINHNYRLPVSELEGLSSLTGLTRLECRSCDFAVAPAWVAAAGVSCDLPAPDSGPVALH